MGCCILAALIIAQFFALRRRLAVWLGVGATRAHVVASPVAWRLHSGYAASESMQAGSQVDAARLAPQLRSDSWMAYDRAGIAVVAVCALLGYGIAAHGAHLAAMLLGEPDRWSSQVRDARCVGLATEAPSRVLSAVRPSPR